MTDLPQGETYLGDGLYVSFDGWHVVLRAPRDHGDHYIALEPDVYRNLRRWIDAFPEMKRHLCGRRE